MEKQDKAMFKAEAKHIKRQLITRCISALLSIAVFFVNTPLSFAAFVSDAKVTLTASVTIGGSVDSDYDGIPDDYDPNIDNPYDAHEMGDDGFTHLERYVLTSRGRNIFDNAISLNLVASPKIGQLPLDVTFTVTSSGAQEAIANIVKYEWDFDGNGTYDRWQYASKGNTVNYKFTSAGYHDVRVRATNRFGEISVATETVNVSSSGLAPAATVSGEIAGMPAMNNIVIPSRRRLSATVSSSVNEIIKYQWDTTGNGEYDISSTKSADATKTFNETISRIFRGALKVTNSRGLSSISYFDVTADATGWDGSDYRPIVYLSNNVINGNAGSGVFLGGMGVPEGYMRYNSEEFGYAKKLEWDFEGDGIYDWSSTVENNDWTGRADIYYKYGAPGIYKATLKAHTEANVSSYKTAIVIIEGPEPSVRANAKVSENGGGIVTEISNGTVPVKATFDHSQSTGAVKYEWDFDGDKRIDYTTTDINANPEYNYTVPGYYVAMLRVTDSQGRIDADYIPVFCVYPASYGSSIKMPKEGQVIAGNSVTLAADVFPDDAEVSSVMFQYSADNGATWINIGEGAPVMSYAKSWDTTVLPNGSYKVRAIVNSMSSDDFKTTGLIIDNVTSTPDVYENVSGSSHVKTVAVDPDQENNIHLPDGTSIEIPYGAIPPDSGTEITVTQNLNAGIGEQIFEVTGIDSFLMDVTITLYYPDENDDGIVDGTNIDENTLKMVWFDDDGEYRELYNTVVYPVENYVTAQTNHFSGPGLIGGAVAAILGGSSSSGSSTASYCFIATAAYGTPMAGDVVTLRAFRDNYLLTNSAGKCFVENYYKYSPPIARFISDKPALRRIVRALLRPLVRVAKALSLRA
jgi:PKD repeat protein